MNTIKRILRLMTPALLAMIMLGLQSAHAVTITSAFTGSWYDPETPGQGFNLEIIEGDDANQVLAYWYSFDGGGSWFWAFGIGGIDGDTAVIPMQRIVGGLLKGGGEFEPWAIVTLSFSDCNTGEADAEFDEQVGSGFDEQVGSGGPMNLVRITQIAGDECSGGISDDGDDPEVFEIYFDNTGVAPEAVGFAEFEMRPDRAEFLVITEDLPLGSYYLLVDDETVGEFEVFESELGGTRGSIEFRSPAEGDELLLDFDPRGMRLDIADTGLGLIYLTTVAPAQGDDPSDDDDVNPPPFGENDVTEVGLENTGIYPAAHGYARLEQRAESVEFAVHIQDLPNDLYSLYVAGDLVGHIEVASIVKAGDTRGDVVFRYPVEPGKELLYFDPRGQILAVVLGDLTVLISEFPEEPNDLCPDFKFECEDPDPEECDPEVEDCECVGDDCPPHECDPEHEECECEGDECEPPEEEKIVIEAAFDPNCEVTNGFGFAKMIIDGDFEYFEVRTEDIPVGSYDVRVGEVVRGNFESKGEEFTDGSIAWSNPVGEAENLLNFDPRGQVIRIEQEGVVFLEMVFPTEPQVKAAKVEECPPPPEEEKIVIEEYFEVDCELASSFGFAKMIIDGDFSYFEVRTEDLPVGFYDVRVGDLIQGTFESKGEEWTSGSIAWSDPVGEAENLLDFDPRGKIVTVELEGQVHQAMVFPEEPIDAHPVEPCPSDEIVIDAGFDATDLAPDGKGVAVYVENPDYKWFYIEVDNIPAGTYGVWVGEAVEGELIVECEGEGEGQECWGRIDWHDPAEGEELFLEFDPRGKTIAIKQGIDVYLVTSFPFD